MRLKVSKKASDDYRLRPVGGGGGGRGSPGAKKAKPSDGGSSAGPPPKMEGDIGIYDDEGVGCESFWHRGTGRCELERLRLSMWM